MLELNPQPNWSLLKREEEERNKEGKNEERKKERRRKAKEVNSEQFQRQESLKASEYEYQDFIRTGLSNTEEARKHAALKGVDVAW